MRGMLVQRMRVRQAHQNCFAIAENQSEEIIEIMHHFYDLFRIRAAGHQTRNGLGARGAG